jgi:glycosyltransferase involved in cell wall biosynthesis
MKVLHVVESLASGVAIAVEDYILNTPEIEHFVLGWRRQGSRTEDMLDQLATVVPMVTGHRQRMRQVSSVANSIQPSLIHAHSSFAGLYARLGSAAGRFPVVYTPHCYALERTDIGRTRRFAFKRAEGLLQARTACVVAGGPREAELATSFRFRRPVVYVPYIVPAAASRAHRSVASPIRVISVGRLCPQKDPDFLAQAAASPAGRHLRWTWVAVGNAEERYVERLSAAGVEVLWLSRPDTLRRLGMSDVYVHTAAWECAPLALLEAAGHGLPIVARRIPALSALGVRALYDSPEELATGVAELVDPTRAGELSAVSEELAARHTPDRQREALLHAYRLTLGEGADPGSGPSASDLRPEPAPAHS